MFRIINDLKGLQFDLKITLSYRTVKMACVAAMKNVLCVQHLKGNP